MGVKTIYETFSKKDFNKLAEVKGDRTWSDAILEEFGVKEKQGDET